MANYYDSVYDKAMTQSVVEPDKTKAAALVLKVFHETVCVHLSYSSTGVLNGDLRSLFLICL